MKQMNVRSHRDHCIVSVPSRTSVSVIDMNTFSPGVAGGGNLGFALDIRTRVQFKIAGTTTAQPSNSYRHMKSSLEGALVTHTVDTWSNVTGIDSNVDITVDCQPPEHVGLASSGALQIAILSGLNWLHGLPLSEYELILLLKENYRELDDGNLTEGFTTGLSAFLGLYGGFAVIDSRGATQFHQRTDAWNVLFAAPRMSHRDNFGQKEAKLLMELGRSLDRGSSERKRDLIENLLIPAVQSNDLPSIGKAVEAIQSIGSKKAEIGSYGTLVFKALESLRNYGAECCFLSAAGPGIVVISKQSQDVVKQKCLEHDLAPLYLTQIDNQGITIGASD